MPPRSRRRSSAILNCSAAAVVKAVLLLRKNPNNDADNNASFPFPTKPSSAPARDYHSRKLQFPTTGRRPRSVRSQQANDALKRGLSGRVSMFGSGNETSARSNAKSQSKLVPQGKIIAKSNHQTRIQKRRNVRPLSKSHLLQRILQTHR